ncbi:hypothetical protein KM914_14320 [Virgibacillus pantothenticus]|uniref:hypothetical protein n=1 Tax=Virgibacillus pantothenticus TaxID=1473 RepID=UPI001C232F16|nr:hypothetical protein [Virgibacillus pantothenticus]MBU8567595.1 hypothetical protein [Virgibacillus pantothenticus]MBU8601383.1 hypothetical protein [Virgibacillus pantothenticus]MBU8636200.1 hypothetical protein [Virgibacillus pantothenticus]MBU8643720.1 hypothetical protein [Virgibacillus pantothenticus]MBU8648024.1 hypothetical protein [Virgibacillus pantothenticus]
MEQEVNWQYVVNALSNQVAQLSQEKAYHEAIIAAQQEEINELKANIPEEKENAE